MKIFCSVQVLTCMVKHIFLACCSQLLQNSALQRSLVTYFACVTLTLCLICRHQACRMQQSPVQSGLDEMGFGASMDIIYNSPTVVDLLISMAAAAASNPNLQHRQRFFACPNPPSDFVSEDLRHINCTNMNDNMGIKWQELQQVCTALLHNSCICICVPVHKW